MVEIVDIRHRDSLRVWLEGQPQEVSDWIARRAAMRVLPIYWQWTVTSDTASERDLTALPVLRFYQISEVARKMPTSKIIADAARAAAAATAAATADAAADAAFGADAAADAAAVWASIRADCMAIGEGGGGAIVWTCGPRVKTRLPMSGRK